MRVIPLLGTRLVVVAVVVLTALVGEIQEAHGGAYLVRQCDHENGILNASFLWEASGNPAPVQHSNSGCSEFGLAVRNGDLGTPRHYAEGAFGGYKVVAPAGTVFGRFSGRFGTLQSCCIPGMEPRVLVQETTDGTGFSEELLGGFLPASSWPAPSGAQGPMAVTWDAVNVGARQVSYALACGAESGCSQSSTGEVRLRGRSFEFVLDDLVAPELDEVDGGLLSEGWKAGAYTLNVAANDLGGGIERLSATLGGVPIADSPSTCSSVGGHYVELRPCPPSRENAWLVDTQVVEDGPATLNIRADDVGGNTVQQEIPIFIDNTAPTAPTLVDVEGVLGWRANPEFSVRWGPMGPQHAPVVRTHYRLCEVPHGACSHGVQEVDTDNRIDIAVPRPGRFSLRLWLEDAAGNVNANALSDAVEMMFDDGVPGQARLTGPKGWINGNVVGVTLGLEEGNDPPRSQIGGYSVTEGGDDPDNSIEVSGAEARYQVEDPGEGVTVIKARAISGAGVPAASVGTAAIKVDRTAPSAVAFPVPGASSWLRGPTRVWIESADQDGLSGVQPAPNAKPVTDGGYIESRLDGRPVRLGRGDRDSVLIDSDGHHRLTYRAFDVAGNPSVEKEVVVRIDGTAPVGRFRGLNSGDPRRLEVEVSDATSGVAGGRIEFRRVGEREFRSLPTTMGQGVLAARIDDGALPAGRYELRAVVSDVAGNEAVIERWADGTAATLGLPLRGATRIEAVGEIATKVCSRTAKKARGKRSGRRSRRPGCRRVTKRATTLAPGFGRRSSSAGRLTNAQGAAVDGATVVVEGQPRSGGGYARLGSVRTDADGRFRFTIPPGPSRTVRYRYDGTDTTLPATAALTTKVAAAARLKASRRRLRNGQTVRFTGRLLGQPIPKAGKVVALQAKVGRRWRTFANPRANAKGAFRHRYRFTATTGLRRYAFRAVVAREAAYPYERGSSPIVRVTVRGAPTSDRR